MRGRYPILKQHAEIYIEDDKVTMVLLSTVKDSEETNGRKQCPVLL